ncbi:hypothetical protein SBRCBS47491_005692 [Sporothrix bragantina]|uniref:Integral membrane protein n=1 Tax=Sporothrix bragantina TaxID=671064 RepID=A0ABP0BYM4_9PEZI
MEIYDSKMLPPEACWINQQFETLRLVTHYLFIFITLALTSLLYTLVFFYLRRRQKRQQRRHKHQAKLARGTHHESHSVYRAHSHKSSADIRLATIAVSSTGAATSDDEAFDIEANDKALDESFRHPGFLIYPIIYVVCTLPLALGRIATMAGAEVPLSYFCAAGALITSNGWLDVLLWGSTRRSIVFGDVGEKDVGINTFTFMRTPPNRRFGNMVWVEGGANKNDANNANRSTKTINGQSKQAINSSRDSSNFSSHMGTSNNSRSSSRDRGHEGMVVPAGGGPFGTALHDNTPSARGETIRIVRDRVLRGPRGWLELGSGGGLSLPGIINGSTSANRSVAASQESLQNLGESGGGLAIQMEMETSVVVEIDDVPQRLRRSHEASTAMPAYDEKNMPHLPPIT